MCKYNTRYTTSSWQFLKECKRASCHTSLCVHTVWKETAGLCTHLNWTPKLKLRLWTCQNKQTILERLLHVERNLRWANAMMSICFLRCIILRLTCMSTQCVLGKGTCLRIRLNWTTKLILCLWSLEKNKTNKTKHQQNKKKAGNAVIFKTFGIKFKLV